MLSVARKPQNAAHVARMSGTAEGKIVSVPYLHLVSVSYLAFHTILALSVLVFVISESQ